MNITGFSNKHVTTCPASYKMPHLNMFLGHSTPQETSFDLTLRAARTLLEIFRSKSYDFITQFTHVSRHFGT